MKQLTLNNSNETIALGERMAADLCPGDVVVLNGDLGAGKTTFTKGIAKGLGIKEIIKSPTFTIIMNIKMVGFRFITWMPTALKTAGQRI